jgi:hypothetical protein
MLELQPGSTRIDTRSTSKLERHPCSSSTDTRSTSMLEQHCTKDHELGPFGLTMTAIAYNFQVSNVPKTALCI